MQLRIEKFSARWFELKPKKLDTGKSGEMEMVIMRVKEWKVEFEDLEATSQKLGLDCEYFGISPPSFAHLNDVRSILMRANTNRCRLHGEGEPSVA